MLDFVHLGKVFLTKDRDTIGLRPVVCLSSTLTRRLLNRTLLPFFYAGKEDHGDTSTDS